VAHRLRDALYATLELFEQLGIARRVNGGGDTLLRDCAAK
jgi:hypothetical protein